MRKYVLMLTTCAGVLIEVLKDNARPEAGAVYELGIRHDRDF
jgi:hypothetical protein